MRTFILLWLTAIAVARKRSEEVQIPVASNGTVVSTGEIQEDHNGKLYGRDQDIGLTF